MKTSDVKKALLTKRVKSDVIPTANLLGSGSARLNMACTGKIKGAYPKGQYVMLAGVSDAGKTWLGMSALAEAANDPEFDNYRLIYDPVEGGASMDLIYFYGDKLQERIEVPKGTWEDPVASETVEDLYDTLDDLQKTGEPFVYVVDSETALGSRVADTKSGKQRKARQQGEDSKGSYVTEKQQYHSRNLHRIRNKLRKTGSILIIITQLRMNMGMGAMFEPYSRPGGLALKFYADVEIWVHLKGMITTDYRGKKRQQGQKVLAKVKRTRITGKKQSVAMTIYHDAGIDDVGDNIEYLVEEKHWPKTSGVIRAKEFGKKMKKDDLIRYIENNNKEGQLRKVVRKVWKEIEAAVAVIRKPRYS